MMISFYQKYRNTILFNKNLLVSGIISFFVGALFTQIYAQYDKNYIANSLITLVIGYAVYIPLFASLFYRDNKAKYIDPLTGKKDPNKINCQLCQDIDPTEADIMAAVQKPINRLLKKNLALRLGSSFQQGIRSLITIILSLPMLNVSFAERMNECYYTLT